jgi:hypothetical protein
VGALLTSTKLLTLCARQIDETGRPIDSNSGKSVSPVRGFRTGAGGRVRIDKSAIVLRSGLLIKPGRYLLDDVSHRVGRRVSQWPHFVRKHLDEAPLRPSFVLPRGFPLTSERGALALLHSLATLYGVEGSPSSVEFHVSNGLPVFTVVAVRPRLLSDVARQGSRRAALERASPPAQVVTVNLAPFGDGIGNRALPKAFFSLRSMIVSL